MLTKYLAYAFEKEQFNSVKLKFIVKVLRHYFDTKKGLEELPDAFFYLFGENCGGVKLITKSFSMPEPVKNVILVK